MGLRLNTVAPRQGWAWARDGMRLYLRRPLGFTGLFALSLLAILILMSVPFVGGLLGMATLPLLTLGFMIASRSALRGGPMHPGMFFDGLRAGAPRRTALLKLCLAYALASIAVIEIAHAFDGGSFERLQVALARGEAGREAAAAELANPLLAQGMVLRLTLATLVSVPFWHAPALVLWGEQGAMQSLFSSTLAVWRAKGAFTVYSLAWAALVLAAGIAVGVLFVWLDLRALVGVLSLPMGLMFSAAFYASLWFTFVDSFSSDAAAA